MLNGRQSNARHAVWLKPLPLGTELQIQASVGCSVHQKNQTEFKGGHSQMLHVTVQFWKFLFASVVKHSTEFSLLQCQLFIFNLLQFQLINITILLLAFLLAAVQEEATLSKVKNSSALCGQKLSGLPTNIDFLKEFESIETVLVFWATNFKAVNKVGIFIKTDT